MFSNMRSLLVESSPELIGISNSNWRTQEETREVARFTLLLCLQEKGERIIGWEEYFIYFFPFIARE
jgi:hypothetical protein